MSQHTAVRIKGSRWQAVAHRASSRERPSVVATRGDADRQGRIHGERADGEGDLVLDLAIRHFSALGLTSREARDIADALLQTAATGQTVTVFPASSSEHPYEISRRLAAVTIRCGRETMRLPIHAARELAALLSRMVKSSPAQDIAA
jgi:hypothetical protein